MRDSRPVAGAGEAELGATGRGRGRRVLPLRMTALAMALAVGERESSVTRETMPDARRLRRRTPASTAAARLPALAAAAKRRSLRQPACWLCSRAVAAWARQWPAAPATESRPGRLMSMASEGTTARRTPLSSQPARPPAARPARSGTPPPTASNGALLAIAARLGERAATSSPPTPRMSARPKPTACPTRSWTG